MRVEYSKAEEKDYNELIDFANYVFSHSGGAIDFPTLLPKLYKTNNNMTNHYIVKEENKIKGVVGAFPLTLNIENESIDLVGIGTVSTHPYSRGAGYMKKLMKMAIEDMKNENVDMSILSGYKQRYQHFLYEPCGQQIWFRILDTNINYAYGKALDSNIKFEFMNIKDEDTIEKAYKLHTSKNIKVIRDKEAFYDILKSWNSSVYSILEDNELIGYMCVNNNSIDEIVLKNSENINKVIATYIKECNKKEIVIKLPVYDERIPQLSKICENYSITTDKNYRIFNYDKVVRIMLNLKATYSNLADGELNIKIKNYGILRIEVKNNNAIVEKVEQDFDIELEENEALEFLFSPINSYFSRTNKMPSFLSSWLPLPLHIENQDCV